MAASELLVLTQAARGCVACPLSGFRRNVVFGEGNPFSPLVLVGEGPGEEEDKTGRPFVGKAGKLLDQALADCGLSRADVYICNTVKCRAADWSTGKPVNRAPMPGEVAACRQWLLPQLAAVNPWVILCIGSPSAKNLIRPLFKITQDRGKFCASEYAHVAIATLHPSYILRNQYGGSDGGYSLLVADITKAWEAATKLQAERGFRFANTPEAIESPSG